MKANLLRLEIALIVCLHFVTILRAEDPPDFSGYYFAKNKLPSAFSDIRWIDLRRGTDPKGAWIVEGVIRLNRLKRQQYVELKFKNAKINGSELFFETVEESNIAYKFSGRFLISDFSQAEVNDKVVLSGVLEKILKGKSISKRNVELTYSAGD